MIFMKRITTLGYPFLVFGRKVRIQLKYRIGLSSGSTPFLVKSNNGACGGFV